MKIEINIHNRDIIEINNEKLKDLNEYEIHEFIDNEVAEWNYKNLSDLKINWRIVKE